MLPLTSNKASSAGLTPFLLPLMSSFLKASLFEVPPYGPLFAVIHARNLAPFPLKLAPLDELGVPSWQWTCNISLLS